MALSRAFLAQEMQVGGMLEREARISHFLGTFPPYFLTRPYFPAQEVAIKAGCVTPVPLHAGDLLCCFLLRFS